MKKLALLGLLLMAFASQAQAGVLSNFLVTGQNTLEDGSRETLLKGAGNVGPGIESGDILIGFSRVTDIPTFPGVFTANSVYAIFSQTFDVITPDLIPGAGFLRAFTFKPTTAAGLTLADLLGGLDPGGLDPSSMLALVSHTSSAFSVNLEIATPTDRGAGPAGVDMFDSLDLLTDEGDLDAVFGLAPASLDYFSGTTAGGITPATDFISDLSLAPALINLVNFEGSLSLTYDKPGLPAITSGALIVGGTARLPGPGENVDGAFTFVDDADLIFSSTIPEPTSLAIWGLMVAGVVGYARYRRS